MEPPTALDRTPRRLGWRAGALLLALWVIWWAAKSLFPKWEGEAPAEPVPQHQTARQEPRPPEEPPFGTDSNLTKDKLYGQRWTWICPNDQWCLGHDFIYCYKASLAWLDRVDPYLQPYGDSRVFHYPPITLFFFTWCALFSFATAKALWTAVIALVVAASGWVACKARDSLGLVLTRQQI
jgi:hypothetical protein